MKPDLAPLPFELTQAEKSEAAVFQCQILRQARERSAIEAATEAKTTRPDRELWISETDTARWRLL